MEEYKILGYINFAFSFENTGSIIVSITKFAIPITWLDMNPYYSRLANHCKNRYSKANEYFVPR